MCNNILKNKLVKKEEKTVDLSIKGNTESRPILKRNILAEKHKVVKDNQINYVSGYPLKLHDGTKIYSISSENHKRGYKDVKVKFSHKGKRKIEEVSFKRYDNDSLEDVEKFLENSQSICQKLNIDLVWRGAYKEEVV